MNRQHSAQWSIFVGALAVAALSLALYDTFRDRSVDQPPLPRAARK